MRKVWLAPALAGVLGCATVGPPAHEILEETTARMYGDRVVYRELAQLEFSGTDFAVPLPSDLGSYFEQTSPWRYGVENDRRMRRLAAREISRRQGWNLPPGASIRLAMDIVLDRMEYARTDRPLPGRPDVPVGGPLERHFAVGVGDCDTYARILVAVFDVLRERNPSLRNVYISDSFLGGRDASHAWNSILVVGSDTLQIAHVDLSRYDALRARGLPASLAVVRCGSYGHGCHLPLDARVFRGNVYHALRDAPAALRQYRTAGPYDGLQAFIRMAEERAGQ